MLKKQAFFATLWSAADVFLRQGLQLLVTVALARLLSPEEFGTIALLSLFIGVSTVLVDSGFSSALIQKQSTTLAEESTVFWFNMFASMLAVMALWLAAPYIASFYDKPVLTNIICLVSLTIFFNAAGAVHTALLTKQLNFRAQLKVGAISNIASGVIAVSLAWKGYGIWALVAQIMLASVLSSILTWIVSSWRPKFVFEFTSARNLFGFGGYMVAASLLNILYSKGYSLLIGKFYSTRELGLYTQAEITAQFPTSMLSTILLRVAFSMLSAISTDKEKLQRAVQLCIRSMMLFNIPMMLGLATIADTMVEAVFGTQWLPAVPVLQILCVGAVLWPVHVININALLAQGHSKLVFNLQIVKSVLGITLLLAGSKYGVIGIAWSQVIFGYAGFLLNTHYTKTYLQYGAARQLRDNMPALLASLPMIVIVHFLNIYWQAPPILKLSGLILAGAFLFSAISYFSQLTAVKDMFSLFDKKQTAPVDAHSRITEF